MISVFIRLLALLGLLWTGKQVVHQVSSMINPNHRMNNQASDQQINGEMVKDPVCQMYVPKSIAIQRNVNGTIHYFCSQECVSKFAEVHRTESSSL